MIVVARRDGIKKVSELKYDYDLLERANRCHEYE